MYIQHIQGDMYIHTYYYRVIWYKIWYVCNSFDMIKNGRSTQSVPEPICCISFIFRRWVATSVSRILHWIRSNTFLYSWVVQSKPVKCIVKGINTSINRKLIWLTSDSRPEKMLHPSEFRIHSVCAKWCLCSVCVCVRVVHVCICCV